MLKNLVRVYLFLAGLLSLLFFNSCSVNCGLGESIDLEYPVISVSSLESGGTTVSEFEGGVYCKKNVVFSGLATDNIKVKRVYAEIKWANSDDGQTTDYVYYNDAELSGTSWVIDVDFEREGACYIKFVAEDSNKNIGSKSFKTLTLFVDETAPVASAWYIDREFDGIQYNLKDLESLQNLDLTKPENKDAAQNVSFTICSNVTDTFGVEEISILIRDEDGNDICTIENSNVGNNYAPKFKVTQEKLIAGDSSLASGKHYLQIFYNSSDVVTLPSCNSIEEAEVELGWFIWWPESDAPQIVNSDLVEEDGELTLNGHVKDLFNFTFFDDDVLDEGYFVLLTASEYQTFKTSYGNNYLESIKENPSILIEAVKADDKNGENTDAEARENRSCHFVSTVEREAVIVLRAAKESQTMRMLAIGWDNTSERKTVTKDFIVHVTDDSSPILLISSPKNNSVPVFNDDGITVSVKGFTLDSAGCSYLEFVWVPSVIGDKESLAKIYLESIDKDSDHRKLLRDGKTTTSEGLIVWGVELGEKEYSNSFYTQNFSFNIDLLNDFVFDGQNEKKLSKYFMAKLTRQDGNCIYQEYLLAADTVAPRVVGITPASDMQIVTNENDVKLEFYAVKDSGLEINVDSYKISLVLPSDSSADSGIVEVTNSLDGYSGVAYNETSGCYEATVSKEKLSEYVASQKIPRYRFYAEDIFGNSNYVQYALVISDLPQLKMVSTTSSRKLKKGDKIDIVASFSKSVGVTEGTNIPYIKIKGIKNTSQGVVTTDALPAYYSSGSGTTNIHFVYEVQEGDVSSGVKLFNASPIEDNSSYSFTSDKVIISDLSTEDGADCKNLFDAKTICLDGVLPKVTDISFEGTGTLDSGLNYLREGSTISCVLTLSENVFITTPAPEIVLWADGDFTKSLVLPFTTLSNNGSNTELTFSKTVLSSEENGLLYYNLSSYIENVSSITDMYDNPVTLQQAESLESANLYVDTSSPIVPKIEAVNSDGLSIVQNNLLIEGKYKENISFTLSKYATTDSTIKWIQYSLDGGSNWIPEAGTIENTSVTLEDSASFTFRAVDKAGNVSEIPEPVYIDIQSSFPSYSVECLASDGNYKAGSKLTFRVYFERMVNVSSNSGAYITISGNNSSDFGGGRAYPVSNSAQSSVDYVDFYYTVTSSDDFVLKIENNAVTLTGFKDLYGISQGNKYLEEDYIRSGIHCDGISPSVSNMVPGTETASGSNVYSGANVIQLTFNENVIKSGGNIILRRAGNWAVPPVLSVSDFNKICASLTSAQKNILSLQEDGHDMEDSEWVNGSTSDYRNKYYHGTGQFVGPYKKSTQGIKPDGSPDTSTKYVLDFDMDIWETTNAHYYSKTFKSSTQLQPTELNASNASKITVGDIRSVLEAAHYHERILDVTSSAVKVTGNTVKITFPAGLCDTSSALPEGIEWELLIEPGCFIDETGNSFGSGSQAIVISNNNGESSFFSSGVQKPVIRVDRYSYGLGIKQPDSSAVTKKITGDSVKPTGYVRTRIDCQTPDVSIYYSKINSSLGSEQTHTDSLGVVSKYKESAAKSVTSLSSNSPSTSYSGIFVCGNGSYTTACRQYIIANAVSSNLGTSDKAYEGIFQTVIKVVNPKQSGGSQIATFGEDWDDFSIRGTTGWSGEPSISPFPLRDAQVGSPYLRLIYWDGSTNKNYYWVSYEILVDTSFSGHSRGASTWDYISGWGWVTPGGYCECSNMKTWS